MSARRHISISSGSNWTKSGKFIWTIKDFDSNSCGSLYIGRQYVELQFGDTMDFKSSWTVSLTPCGNMIKLCLVSGVEMQDKDGNDIKVDVQLTIRKDDDTYFFNQTKRAVANRVDPYLFYECEFDVIRKDAKLEELPLTNGNLVFVLEIISFGSTPIQTGSEITDIKYKFKPKFADKLQLDLTKVFGQTLSLSSSKSQVPESPVKIMSADNVEFDVPQGRAMLSARSPVFEAMFQAKMSEDNTGIIKIDDISSKTIPVLLQYICIGTLHDDWSNPDVILELTYAAGKYQFEELLDFLDEALGCVCSKENVGKLYGLAEKLNLRNAQQTIFEFMKNNCMSTFNEMVAFLDANGLRPINVLRKGRPSY